MKLSRNKFLVPVLLIAAIVIIGLNAVLALRSLQKLDSSQFMVEHTWKVINQVERIMSSAKDAETGSRGFLLTNDSSYLEPYSIAVKDLPGELESFRTLTSDNPSQQSRIVLMRAVLEQRLGLLAHGIELRRSGETASMQALVVSGTGKAQMDRLRGLADEAEAEERRLLSIRTGDVKASAKRARQTLLLATGLDLILIILIFRYFARERAIRMESEAVAAALAVSRAELERKAEEIAALNVTLEERVRQRTAELENTNRELEAFSYSVSHDLRAPLRTIDGFSLALEEDYTEAVDAVGRDYIKRVRAGVQRMGQLIDALLQLSRVTRADITREPIDLSALANNVAANIREENPERDLDITIDPDMRVEADPKLLRVALENLLGNAAKFTSKIPNPIIHFGWDEEQDAYFVKDNGAGFDMNYSAKLFNAFNRLHGDKDFKGSGIGLATVARVIGRHHGRIWAHGQVDHGATFFFTVGLRNEH
jgi:signal transduction histidine kinase